MENLLKLKELADLFTEDIKSIDKLTTYAEIDALERKCIHELQGIQAISANAVFRDLHAVVAKARRALSEKPLEILKEEVKTDVEATSDNSEVEGRVDDAGTAEPEVTPEVEPTNRRRGRIRRAIANNRKHSKAE